MQLAGETFYVWIRSQDSIQPRVEWHVDHLPSIAHNNDEADERTSSYTHETPLQDGVLHGGVHCVSIPSDSDGGVAEYTNPSDYG